MIEYFTVLFYFVKATKGRKFIMCIEERKQALGAIASSRLVIEYLENNREKIIDLIIQELLKSNDIHNAKLKNENILLKFKQSLINSDFKWMIEYTNLPNSTIINLDKYRANHLKDLYFIYYNFFQYFTKYIENETYEYPEVARKMKSLCTKLSKKYK